MDMRWNWIGIDIPTVCSGTSYHAILYHTVSFLSSPSFLVSFFVIFVRCVGMRRAVSTWDFTTTYVSSVIIFLVCSSFS